MKDEMPAQPQAEVTPLDPPRLDIAFGNGLTATLVESDGDKTTIHSPTPAPPGATVRGRVAETQAEFQLKVRNCVKQGEHFFIDGRIKNPSRELRALLIRYGSKPEAQPG